MEVIELLACGPLVIAKSMSMTKYRQEVYVGFCTVFDRFVPLPAGPMPPKRKSLSAAETKPKDDRADGEALSDILLHFHAAGSNSNRSFKSVKNISNTAWRA